MPVKTERYCTVTIQGMHHWPEAPTEFDYQRMDHMHVFTIRVYITDQVATSALEKGIRLFLDEFYYNAERGIYDLGTVTCENLALELMGALTYDVTRVEVDANGSGVVLTDNESSYGIKGSLIFVPDDPVDDVDLDLEDENVDGE